jgi:hypothetical protein
MQRDPRPATTGAPYALAVLSLGCAAIHGVVVAPHLREYAPFGWFFLVVAVLQLAWAALIVARPTRTWLVVGAAANLAIAVIWIWSRTTGLPIGPEPGVAEAVGVRDVVSTAYEIVLAAVALYALVPRSPLERRAGQAVAVFAVVIAVITAIAATSPEPEGRDMGTAAPRVTAAAKAPAA